MLKLKLSLILFYTLSVNIYSQPTVEDLDNPSPLVRSNALLQIYDLKLFEFADELEVRIFAQPEPFMIDMYLRTLKEIESPNLYEITIQFMGIADDFANMNPPKDPLESKVMATDILFSFGDYSTANYVFEILERDRPQINEIALALLKEIILNVPEHEQQAKSELLYIVNNIPATTTGPEDFNRYNAVSYLSEIYGSEVQENVINLFRNDPFMSVRSKCLKILFDLNYQDLNQLLKERLLVDSDWPLRISIVDSLCKVFGEPSDLKAVIDYQPNEPDETAKSLMGYSIDEFIPPKPASLNLLVKVTKLISYVSEMYSYQWIANTLTRDYYITKLNLLKRQIESSRFRDACTTVNNDLLPRIETDLTANNITIESYKFLHYYCLYIKEDFPQGIQPCP
jgi:hypothetical protein